MAFKIKNLRPTFLTIELTSQTLTLHSLGEAGLFEDAEYSPGLQALENRGDVATFYITSTPGAGAQPAPKAARPIKEDNAS